MLSCPTDEHLSRFLEGELDEIERQQTAAIVDESSEVQQRLEALIGPDETLPLRKGGEPTAFEDVPGLESLVERLCRQPPPPLVVRKSQRADQLPIHFPDAPTPDAPLGQLGPFRIVERVASGAGGVVFKAVDSQLNRTVAVKVLRAELAEDEAARTRFVREAQAAASLNHDHVVTVHQVYDEPTFLPCLIMEYIPGQSLRERLRESGPVSLQEAARIVREAACGLATAHESGLIHRDVKPSNIMLEDESQRAKITDFGLARLVESATRVTATGSVVGTPAYMSPDQIAEPDSVDGRSDIYSLGVVLYELLTGELPFRGNVQQTVAQILHDAPPAPRAANREVDRDLETICLKTLAKEPDDRYQSARDLAEDLSRWLDGKPIEARPVGVVGRLWRRCKQSPARLAVAGALIVAFVAVPIAVVVALRPGGVDNESQEVASAWQDAAAGVESVTEWTERVAPTVQQLFEVLGGLEPLISTLPEDAQWRHMLMETHVQLAAMEQVSSRPELARASLRTVGQQLVEIEALRDSEDDVLDLWLPAHRVGVDVWLQLLDHGFPAPNGPAATNAALAANASPPFVRAAIQLREACEQLERLDTEKGLEREQQLALVQTYMLMAIIDEAAGQPAEAINRLRGAERLLQRFKAREADGDVAERWRAVQLDALQAWVERLATCPAGVCAMSPFEDPALMSPVDVRKRLQGKFGETAFWPVFDKLCEYDLAEQGPLARKELREFGLAAGADPKRWSELREAADLIAAAGTRHSVHPLYFLASSLFQAAGETAAGKPGLINMLETWFEAPDNIISDFALHSLAAAAAHGDDKAAEAYWRLKDDVLLTDFLDTLTPLLRKGDDRAFTLLEREAVSNSGLDFLTADALRPAVEDGVPRAVALFETIARRSPDVDPDGTLLGKARGEASEEP